MSIMSLITKGLLGVLFLVTAGLTVTGVFMMAMNPILIVLVAFGSILAVFLGHILWQYKIGNEEKNKSSTLFVGGMLSMVFALLCTSSLEFLTYFLFSSVWFGVAIYKNQ